MDVRGDTGSKATAVGLATTPPLLSEADARAAQRAPSATLILDYDGTLTPIVATPDLAVPDAELLALLHALAAREGIDAHVVSGRPREDLERWLGALPIGLHAEHGFWSRRRDEGSWTSLGPPAAAWKAEVRETMLSLSRRAPGTLVEEKSVSLAFHYRGAGPARAREALGVLRAALAPRVDEGVIELLAGAEVLEVRPRGVHKGRPARAVVEAAPRGAAIVAIGDDRTDEDLFAALPAGALTIHVGEGPSRARARLPSPADVRRFLRGFVA